MRKPAGWRKMEATAPFIRAASALLVELEGERMNKERIAMVTAALIEAYNKGGDDALAAVRRHAGNA